MHQRNTKWMMGLGMVVALTTSGLASAAIISFENPPGPGHFNWQPAAIDTAINLNIRFAADTQTSANGDPGSYRQNWSSSGTALAISGTNRAERVTAPSGTYNVLFGTDLGNLIPSPAPVGFAAGNVHRFAPPAGDPEFCFPEGVAKYLGVRFDAGSGIQYGWIGVIRNGSFLDPFAWAYETTPGVPIAAGAVPEPGTISLLAFGAVGVLRRRRV